MGDGYGEGGGACKEGLHRDAHADAPARRQVRSASRLWVDGLEQEEPA
jgi:hypothetical protein